jgi:DNA-directed RNA polymerase subunit RPC12/RpoP
MRRATHGQMSLFPDAIPAKPPRPLVAERDQQCPNCGSRRVRVAATQNPNVASVRCTRCGTKTLVPRLTPETPTPEALGAPGDGAK